MPSPATASAPSGRRRTSGAELEGREFRRLVREAVALLPPALLKRVENVVVVVQRRPTARERKATGVRSQGLLLGLYQGVPLPARGAYYGNVLPDKITLYQDSIEAVANGPDEIREQVRKTVLHELGHYFGIDDQRLNELGMG